MATRYILNINNNDELHTVIKKCNTNFKAIMSQIEKINKNSSRQLEDNAESASEDLSNAVADIIRQLDAEAELRRASDGDLTNSIETVNNKFLEYTKTSDLADVALSGDYNDLINTP